MVRVLKSNSSAPKIPSIEIHEPREQQQQHNEPIWRTKMHRIAIEFAGTFIGQAIMMQFDKLLWTLEKTTTWISSGKTDAKKSAHLIRPLPWVLFLPTLVALRYTRVILSLLSICLGYDEIEVSTMVGWLHQSRRTIRHIVHKAKQNEQLNAAVAAATTAQSCNNNSNRSIDCFKRIILSMISNLSGLIFSTPYTIAVHNNNKTSLDSRTVDETQQRGQKQQQQQKTHNNDNGIVSNTDNEDSHNDGDDDSDDEDQAYQDFLSRTIESSDADDEDFVHDVNGGGDISTTSSSDMDSQSSIASENLSNDDDDEIDDMNRSAEAETSKTSEATEALENDSHTNAMDDTNVANDRSENAAEEGEDTKQNDIENDATQNVQIDNALNQLIDDTATAMGNKSVARQNRGGKNNKRHHKNGGGSGGGSSGAGRSHAKAQQNNGKHFNGAHSQDENGKLTATAASSSSSSPNNHHVNTFHEFTVTETANDHTQTD